MNIPYIEAIAQALHVAIESLDKSRLDALSSADLSDVEKVEVILQLSNEIKRLQNRYIHFVRILD